MAPLLCAGSMLWRKKTSNQVKFYFIAPIACLQSHNLDGA